LCFVFSCSSDNELIGLEPGSEFSRSVEKRGTSDVVLVNGILKVHSKDHLANVINELRSSGYESKKWGDHEFISLLDVQSQIRESDYLKIAESGDLEDFASLLYFRETDGERQIDLIVEDKALASLLNKNSTIIIDEDLFIIEAERVRSIKYSADLNIKAFLENKINSFEYKIERESSLDLAGNGSTARLLDTKVQYTYNTVTYRFVGEFYRHNLVVYQSVGAKVKHERKHYGWFGIVTWPSFNAPSISFTGSGTVVQGGVHIPFTVSGSGTNTSEVTDFLTESAGLVWSNVQDATGTATCGKVGGGTEVFTFTR